VLEHIKNSCVVVSKEWLDEAKALKVDPTSELKLISLINMTHRSLDDALDCQPLMKINPRVTNPRKTVDIHEKSTLGLEKEDDINEHGSYFMNTSLILCSHEKSTKLIGLSNITTHRIFNPFMLLVHKNFERVAVDAFVYHKYCKSRCVLA
jgi:hypothetical protein